MVLIIPHVDSARHLFPAANSSSSKTFVIELEKLTCKLTFSSAGWRSFFHRHWSNDNPRRSWTDLLPFRSNADASAAAAGVFLNDKWAKFIGANNTAQYADQWKDLNDHFPRVYATANVILPSSLLNRQCNFHCAKNEFADIQYSFCTSDEGTVETAIPSISTRDTIIYVAKRIIFDLQAQPDSVRNAEQSMDTKEEYEFLLLFHHIVGEPIPFLQPHFIEAGIDALSKEGLFFTDTFLNRFKAEVLSFFTYPELMNRCPSGKILYGPPGSGKTKLISIVAKYLPVRFCVFSSHNFQRGIVGAGEQCVKEIFDRLQTNPHMLHIYLFDEADSMFCDRAQMTGSNHMNSLVTTFLTLMEGHHNLLMIATTNHKDKIDHAFKRAGRLGVTPICFPLPDEHARRRILRSVPLLKWSPQSSSDSVEIMSEADAVYYTSGLSAGEMQGVVDALLSESLKTRSKVVTLKSFMSVLHKLGDGNVRLNHISLLSIESFREINDSMMKTGSQILQQILKENRAVWMINRDDPNKLAACHRTDADTFNPIWFTLPSSVSEVYQAPVIVHQPPSTSLPGSELEFLFWMTHCLDFNLRYMGGTDFSKHAVSHSGLSLAQYIQSQVNDCINNSDDGSKPLIVFDLPQLCPIQRVADGQTSQGTQSNTGTSVTTQSTTGVSTGVQGTAGVSFFGVHGSVANSVGGQHSWGTSDGAQVSSGTTSSDSNTTYRMQRLIDPQLMGVIQATLNRASVLSMIVLCIVDKDLVEYFEPFLANQQHQPLPTPAPERLIPTPAPNRRPDPVTTPISKPFINSPPEKPQATLNGGLFFQLAGAGPLLAACVAVAAPSSTMVIDRLMNKPTKSTR